MAEATAADGEDSKVTFMDLPAEIRTHIYGYVLEEDSPINIKIIDHYKKNQGVAEILRADSHRNLKHRGQVYDKNLRRWVPAPPTHTAILFTNRQVFAEAIAVLYSANTFRFQNTKALRGFLTALGNRVQYLRSICFTAKCYVKNVARPAFKLLTAAKGLKKLQFEHCDICPSRYSGGRHITASHVLADCKTLLKALHQSYQTNNLSHDILDVICINPEVECWQCEDQFGPKSTHVLRCGCTCDSTKRVDERFHAEVRSGIAKMLGIEESSKDE